MDVYRLLRRDSQLGQQTAMRLLQAHFPPSIHEAILDAVGMPSLQLADVRASSRPPSNSAAALPSS